MKRWELLEKVMDGRLTLAGLCYSAIMPRVARILVPGVPHHITQRGNNRQDVFCADDNRDVYLDLLERHA